MELGAVETTIQEDKELNLEEPITGQMVGGLKVNLANIIVTADVKATDSSGAYGNAYRANSAVNNTMSLNVVSGASVQVNVTVSNSAEGYIMAEYTGTVEKIKLQIKGPDGVTYTYNLHGQGYEVFPLTAGSVLVIT